MKNSELVREVGFSVELSGDFLSNNDCIWLMNTANFYDGYNYAVKIGTKEEGFLKAIADADHNSCSQKLISVLKSAKKMGARWVIFSKE